MREESFHKLLNRINTDFSHNTDKTSAKQLDLKYDFHKAYRYFYFNHNYDEPMLNSGNLSKDETKNSISDNNLKRRNTKYSLESQENNENDSFDKENKGCDRTNYKLSSVWCMDYAENLIVIGCADGRLELWEGTTGVLKVRLKIHNIINFIVITFVCKWKNSQQHLYFIILSCKL